jgi:hypothetical protein
MRTLFMSKTIERIYFKFCVGWERGYTHTLKIKAKLSLNLNSRHGMRNYEGM